MLEPLKKTALMVVAEKGQALPDYVHAALQPDLHPQVRTRAFHQFYEAPIHDGPFDPEFRHMDDQRVAFRAGFVMSEIIELLEKGLGLQVEIRVNGAENGGWHPARGSANGPITTAILRAMSERGGFRNGVEVVDALGDLNVVVNGFALELGADMNAIDTEVCASNFTKPDEDGNPIVSDGSDGQPKGKVLKGPNFLEPQIGAVLGLVE